MLTLTFYYLTGSVISKPVLALVSVRWRPEIFDNPCKESLMLSGENFADKLCKAVREKGTFLCCGLDPQLRYMPPHLIRQAVEMHGRTFEAIGWLFQEFNRRIIDAVHPFVVCVKPQMAFYEIYGEDGISAYYQTVCYAQEKGLLVITDAKRGDGGDTADAYADGYLGTVPFWPAFTEPLENLTRVRSATRTDCMTVHGYIGEDCVGRFITRVKENGTGIFVVTKTSFKPNSAVEQLVTKNEIPVWQELAIMVKEWGKDTEGSFGLRNVGVVMGATYPEDALIMRDILPDSIFLIPGYGAQGSGAKDAVVGIRKDGLGGVVNNSRALIYAWQNTKGRHQCLPEHFDAAAAAQARDDRDALVVACQEAGKWPHS